MALIIRHPCLIPVQGGRYCKGTRTLSEDAYSEVRLHVSRSLPTLASASLKNTHLDSSSQNRLIQRNQGNSLQLYCVEGRSREHNLRNSQSYYGALERAFGLRRSQ